MRLLSPAGIAAMHQAAAPADTTEVSYGMGWYVGALDGTPALYHGGDNGNFATYLLMLPQEKLGVAVLSNVNGLAVVGGVQQIAEGVLTAVLGKQPQPYQRPAMWPWVVGSVVVPTAVSLLWVVGMVYYVVRRRRRGMLAQRNARWLLGVVVLPLLVDLGLLWVLLFGIPTLWEFPLSGMAVMFPDMFMLVIGSVIAVAGWGLARTALTLRSAK